MDPTLRTRTEGVLEGVPLPADRRQLLEYARSQGAGEDVLAALRSLRGSRYDRIDAVGEELAPVQPLPVAAQPPPRPESGAPPGGERYTA